ncbi:Zinc metalloproteinase nas-13 [Halotydeus destructor]|nr:Zinc metalloproteinase nas-13 [Halotydeus destructor]
MKSVLLDKQDGELNIGSSNTKAHGESPLKRWQLRHGSRQNGRHRAPMDWQPSPLALAMDSGEPLGPEDFARTVSLTESDLAPVDQSSIYSPLYFEGDIRETASGRNALKDPRELWPNGRIPYLLSKRFSEKDRTVLAAAVQTYHDRTCLRFEPKNSTDYDFIYIYPGLLGCASQVGRAGGMQYVSLGSGCSYVGIAQHELMHTSGFWHEQSRADRDDYIRILWDNIEPGMAYNFDKYTLEEIQHLDVPYDYGSVMHYGSHAFAKGFGPTIVPRAPATNIGQRKGLSDIDILKVNLLYNCPQAKKSEAHL